MSEKHTNLLDTTEEASPASSSSLASPPAHGSHEPSPTNSRRAFLAQAGLAGISALAAGSLASSVLAPIPAQAQSGDINDADILNFALNLEYLEAEFYLRAAFGTGLSNNDITPGGSGISGSIGPVTGGSAVPFTTPAIRQYAEEIAIDEQAHVRFLRQALDVFRVARPAIDLNQAFTNAARAAGVIASNQTFNPFADENSFLLAAFIFEDVGVTAYKGAAPLIKNKAFLEAAAGILAVEAYHAAEVRTVLFQRGFADPVQKISDLRDSVDGTDDRDQGIVANGKANIVPTDSNGIAFSRSARQVLNIVYLGGTSSGGFFPNGLNGRIR